MDTFKERSRADIQVEFFDPAGAPAVPTTITYSTYCESTHSTIKTDVAVATPAASITITLDANDNAIQDPTSASEIKVLTIKSTYGTGDEANDQYRYSVENLSRVS